MCVCVCVCVCVSGVRRPYRSGNPFSNSQCWSVVTLIDSQPGISQPVRQLIQDQSDCSLRVLERAVELNMLDSDTVSCLQNTNSHHRLISGCRLLASALRPEISTPGLPTPADSHSITQSADTQDDRTTLQLSAVMRTSLLSYSY